MNNIIWIPNMPYSPEGYVARAEECVRLANLTQDDMVSAELLKLRQSYLTIAERLRTMNGGAATRRKSNPD